MTIEDLPDPPIEGDSLTTRYQYFIPGSEDPVTYSVSAAPMPSECEFSFFDPNDPACQEILFNPKTSVSELFAILRQWVPQVQQNIDVIGNEIIKRGCNVNDRDGLTDMTILHYTCKSGAHGIGDVNIAAKFASQLIELGADINLRSRWTNMNALHYAAYFDVPELITVILKNAKPKDVDATCSDFDFGTALHIAAFNLCTGTVKRLLEHGANPAFRVGTLRFCGTTEFASGQWAGIELDEPEGKNNGTVAKVQYFKCAPKHGIFAPLSKISKASERKKSPRISSSCPLPVVKSKKIDVTRVSSKVNSGLSALKKESTSDSAFLGNERGMKTPPGKEATSLGSSSNSSSTTSLDSKRNCPKRWNSSSNKKEGPKAHSVASKNVAGGNYTFPSARRNPFDEGEIQIGDRVLVVGQRTGIVRFHGTTKFAPGLWCGIELDKPHGKNDGSVAGVQYFSCPPRYGVFAPPSRVQRLTGSLDSLTDVSSSKMNHSLPGFRRSFSTTSASSQKEINRRNSFVKSKNSVLRRSWSNTTTTTNTEGPVKLHEGFQVLLTSSSEMGTIRYIGPTNFAPGIWLGLELRSAKGKNDGAVGDKRYFSCKPNHGVLVRPSRVTYRGINGMKLVDDIC
ncbi:CAP-Gly domain-containing linker protein 4 isoform X2 [Anolis carolinensis]|uniref:CAP-Gly domain-containing linker protein 4 isoform X2 n=1 Tax=Anolis carolinensis TaxID=28377 RepID=UPI002F2B52E8